MTLAAIHQLIAMVREQIPPGVRIFAIDFEPDGRRVKFDVRVVPAEYDEEAEENL